MICNPMLHKPGHNPEVVIGRDGPYVGLYGDICRRQTTIRRLMAGMLTKST